MGSIEQLSKLKGHLGVNRIGHLEKSIGHLGKDASGFIKSKGQV